MTTIQRTSIQCPRCGTRFEAAVTPVIDVKQDPNAKARLLSGQMNVAQCPNCGAVVPVATPLVYHDPGKQLLITYMPMELGLPKDRQEKIVGDLIRQVTASLPKDAPRGYFFQPKSALTMQGLIDQVLQADGITPEMMEAQRAKMRLVETFIQTPDEQLPELVAQFDDQIDSQFLQMMTIVAQRMLQEGRPDLAQNVLQVQQRVVELSTLGQQLIQQNALQEQVVQEVADDLQSLGANADRKTFLDLAQRYAGDEQRLQALVGLARPVFDYQFFQELTTRIGQAPAAERDKLEALRDMLLQFTAIIDQQTQLAVQESAELLQVILNDPNPEELIRANAALIDDTFMAVLAANIQEAERRADIGMSAKLKDIYNRVVDILRENMQPELRFINDLLSAQTEAEARALIGQGVEQYGDRLLEMMDMVGQAVASRGDSAMLKRLSTLREATEQALG